MMDAIRKSITNTKGFYNALLESEGLTSPDVKDMFLDDPEALVLGAENDPEVAKFVESIPVDDEDAQEATEADVKKIVESMETYFSDLGDATEEAYEGETDEAINDKITSETDFSAFDDPDTLEGCVKESDDDIDEDDDDDFDAFDD